MKHKVLDNIPISGELAEIHFGETDPDSLWIKFCPDDSENWLGSFANGSLAFTNRKILEISKLSKFAVLNNGAFYLIDLYSKEILMHPEETYYCDFEFIAENDHLILATFWAIFVFKANLLIKVIKPDSIDGIKFVKRIDTTLIGEISDPGDNKSEFELDLISLKLKWGKYEY
jgi:hypothetical protein